MMYWMSKLNKKGFTLIELLVVIAIISLLVSMLLPSLKTAKELAKSAVCSANLRSMGTAMQLYASDYEGFLPPGYGADGLGEWDAKGNWVRCLQGYLGFSEDVDIWTLDDLGIFKCPAADLNCVWYAIPKNLSTNSVWGVTNWTSLASISNPASTINLLDSPYANVIVVDWWCGASPGGFTSNADRRAFRHPGQTDNFLFCAGNVSKLKDGEDIDGTYTTNY